MPPQGDRGVIGYTIISKCHGPPCMCKYYFDMAGDSLIPFQNWFFPILPMM